MFHISTFFLSFFLFFISNFLSSRFYFPFFIHTYHIIALINPWSQGCASCTIPYGIGPTPYNPSPRNPIGVILYYPLRHKIPDHHMRPHLHAGAELHGLGPTSHHVFPKKKIKMLRILWKLKFYHPNFFSFNHPPQKKKKI
jgi:hypothetical protein